LDKYEYKVRAEQIKTLLESKEYAEAMKVADTVDWRRVKSVSMLCTVSEIYKINRKYEESRDILLLAYERYPGGRMIVYALCELAIKMEEYVLAVEYMKEFAQIAPRDTGIYILRYKLYEAQDVPLEEKIEVLEEFKQRDYRERWAYELAYLYHRVGLGTRCVEECDEIMLWFGEGKYVIKAMELKMLHEPLTEEQLQKYNARNIFSEEPQQREYGNGRSVEISSQVSSNARKAEHKMGTENTDKIFQLFGNIPIDRAEQSQVISDDEIEVKPMNMSKYSTMNLQEELAKSMHEFLTNEESSTETDYAAYQELQYSPQEQVYVPQQEQYIPQEQVYAPQQEQYIPQEQIYAPQQEQYIPQEQIYAPQQEQYIPQEQIYAPQQEQYIPQEQIYAPQQEQYIPQEQIYAPQQEQYIPQEQVYAPQQEQYIPQEQTSEAQEELKTSKQSYEEEFRKESEYDRMLAQELDGQISLSLPEEEIIDKQMTGQICIEDVLKEWETKKQDNNIKRKEEARRKALDQTNDILAQLVGVIPGIVAPTKDNKSGDLFPNEKTMSDEVKEQTSEYEKDTLTTEEPRMMTIEEELMAMIATSSDSQGEENNVKTNNVKTNKEESIIVGNSEVRKVFDIEDKQKALEVTGKIPDFILPSMPKVYSEKENINKTIENVEELSEIEEIEEIDQPEEIGESIFDEEIDQLEEISESIFDEEMDQVIHEEEELSSEVLEEDNSSAEIKEAEGKVLKKGKPSYMTLEERPKSKRDFDEKEQRIFAAFNGIEVVKAQLVEAMEKISMDGDKGNVIILGPIESGRKDFAIDIIKAMQITESRFSGKVAKITGKALNKKDISSTLAKLGGGALIVEEAGELSKETLQSICNSLKNEKYCIAIVIEDKKNALKPLMDSIPEINQTFNIVIDLPEFSNDDLIAYAKGYARECEYGIDEMGILALYTRIGELQAVDHIVSLEEVRAIIDVAIKHVDKKNMSHFIDILFAKRYDDEDFIILKEKDFITKQ